jgi:pyrroline-5-carboxylate reductase
VAEPVASRRDELVADHPGLGVVAAVTDLVGDPPLADGAVLAVKPDQVEAACRALRTAGVPRVLSVVAGVPTGRLESLLAPGAAVVRAMPNTPALVGAGVSAIAGGETVTGADLSWADDVLSAVGQVVRLPERLLDAVTGLSGSGPAYLCLVAEAMVDAGVAMGLPRDVATTLTLGTLTGTGALLATTGDEPAVARAAVTSPGGTTAAGLRVLEQRAVRSAFIEAVAAATERSRSLAR